GGRRHAGRQARRHGDRHVHGHISEISSSDFPSAATPTTGATAAAALKRAPPKTYASATRDRLPLSMSAPSKAGRCEAPDRGSDRVKEQRHTMPTRLYGATPETTEQP